MVVGGTQGLTNHPNRRDQSSGYPRRSPGQRIGLSLGSGSSPEPVTDESRVLQAARQATPPGRSRA